MEQGGELRGETDLRADKRKPHPNFLVHLKFASLPQFAKLRNYCVDPGLLRVTIVLEFVASLDSISELDVLHHGCCIQPTLVRCALEHHLPSRCALNDFRARIRTVHGVKEVDNVTDEEGEGGHLSWTQV